MDYLLDLGAFSGIFALPCDVVDRYINEASPDDLKVLLYVFRSGGRAMDLKQMAGFLGLSEERIKKSLRYWEGKNLIAPSPSLSREEPQRKIIDAPITYTSDDITRKAKESGDIRFLLEAAPEKLGKLLSPAECSLLVYLCDGAGLPADVILMVIEYCRSVGKCNLRYIEKTALSWADEGVTTHEQAEEKIRRLEALRGFEGKVKSIMGITGRALTQSERQHITRWREEWSIPPELVRLAYDICVNRTGKLSFSYINSILKSWHQKGFRTEEQAKGEARPVKKANAPSFNIDEYDRIAMEWLHKENI
jgi:DnaD/phage-associated family protein